MTRTYRQNARARASAQSRDAILRAMVDLWRTRDDLDQVSLADIAALAGVSVQTVLRKFGSKDGLVDACLEAQASGVESMRDRAPVGDPAGALDVLLAHYERDGDAALAGLAREGRSAIAAKIAAHGRTHHRAWCARVFAPLLPLPDATTYAARLDAFVAATDLYVWKLLRRDLGRSPAETRDVLLVLVEGVARHGEMG